MKTVLKSPYQISIGDKILVPSDDLLHGSAEQKEVLGVKALGRLTGLYEIKFIDGSLHSAHKNQLISVITQGA